jgi:hypothetical protein
MADTSERSCDNRENTSTLDIAKKCAALMKI